MTPNNIVTTALTYANGPVHLGHMVEQIQADIWVRFQRLIGNHCLFIGGDDAHGTPIMLSAEQQNITPEDLIASIHQQRLRDFAGFNISFDHYGTTHCPQNQALTEQVYNALTQNGHIVSKEVEQAFDTEKNLFLPDRFVKGTCPKCGATDQYGDNCEQCGATYDPTELIDPRSVLSGTTPIQKTSTHLFLKLDDQQTALEQWLQQSEIQPAVANKLKEWFEQGLQDWCISRDAPYFGFEIPDQPGKYFYVWLDAPLGYLAILQAYCDTQPELDFEQLISPDSPVALYHFIGKDIIFFHSLYWPAMLASAELRTPSGVHAHGFLTVNGAKMSKSRGTFITADAYLEHLDAEYLRYYFASKLSDGVEDIDLNWQDFQNRINADLVGKVINIASRCAGFINKHFAGQLATQLHQPALFEQSAQAATRIADAYQSRQFSRATREIMQLADQANQYIAEQAPWQLIKDPANTDNVQQICTTALNLFKNIILFLQPVTPSLAAQTADFLNLEAWQWNDSQIPLLEHTINTYPRLLERVSDQAIAPFTNTDND